MCGSVRRGIALQNVCKNAGEGFRMLFKSTILVRAIVYLFQMLHYVGYGAYVGDASLSPVCIITHRVLMYFCA